MIITTRGKNGFVTATKIRTTNEFFVASTKNFAAASKRFVDITKHFVVVTKYFCYPYFNKCFCWYNKTFFSVRKVRPEGCGSTMHRLATSSKDFFSCLSPPRGFLYPNYPLGEN